MSAPDASRRELIAFAGPVQCEQSAGAVNLVLRGHTLATQQLGAGLSEVLFSDATAAAWPSGLRDLRIIELAAGGAVPLTPRRFRVEGPDLQCELQARSVQLHRDAGTEFYGAVPPPRVPLRLRLGWTLLLSLLRIPGAATLVSRLRGTP